MNQAKDLLKRMQRSNSQFYMLANPCGVYIPNRQIATIIYQVIF